nr:MAG TPA: hypothetical protein [Caudoviricetes sp.]
MKTIQGGITKAPDKSDHSPGNAGSRKGNKNERSYHIDNRKPPGLYPRSGPGRRDRPAAHPRRSARPAREYPLCAGLPTAPRLHPLHHSQLSGRAGCMLQHNAILLHRLHRLHGIKNALAGDPDRTRAHRQTTQNQGAKLL